MRLSSIILLRLYWLNYIDWFILNTLYWNQKNVFNKNIYIFLKKSLVSCEQCLNIFVVVALQLKWKADQVWKRKIRERDRKRKKKRDKELVTFINLMCLWIAKRRILINIWKSEMLTSKWKKFLFKYLNRCCNCHLWYIKL